jgi:hypothetical protein
MGILWTIVIIAVVLALLLLLFRAFSGRGRL